MSVSKLFGPVSAAALAHTRREKHPHLFVDLRDATHLLRHFRHFLVIADRRFRRYQLIGPSVIQKQLAVVTLLLIDLIQYVIKVVANRQI